MLLFRRESTSAACLWFVLSSSPPCPHLIRLCVCLVLAFLFCHFPHTSSLSGVDICLMQFLIFLFPHMRQVLYWFDADSFLLNLSDYSILLSQYMNPSFIAVFISFSSLILGFYSIYYNIILMLSELCVNLFGKT